MNAARRIDARQVRNARRRAQIMAARAVRDWPEAAMNGRLAGRLGRDLVPLNPQLDYSAAELDMLRDPQLAARIFAAAAAALMSRRLSRIITHEAISACKIPMEAREFALRHPMLSLKEDAAPDHARLVQQVTAIWAARLPGDLAREYGPGGPIPEAPPPPPRPEPVQPRRQSWPHRPAIVLPLAAAPPQVNPHEAALLAAMTAFLPPPRSDERLP